MVKKTLSLFQNVYLLYFLFIATILHLGYFILTKETRSLVLFSLVALFVYLVNPNMIIVLTLSLVFVDVLYLVQSTQEGLIGTGVIEFLPEDENGKVPGIDCSLNDPSCNVLKGKYSKKSKKEPFETSGKNAVNPLVNSKELILNETDAFTDNTTLSQVEDESDTIKEMLEKIKKKSPELIESLKMVNSIDMTEVNKLLNLLTDDSD